MAMPKCAVVSDRPPLPNNAARLKGLLANQRKNADKITNARIAVALTITTSLTGRFEFRCTAAVGFVRAAPTQDSSCRAAEVARHRDSQMLPRLGRTRPPPRQRHDLRSPLQGQIRRAHRRRPRRGPEVVSGALQPLIASSHEADRAIDPRPQPKRRGGARVTPPTAQPCRAEAQSAEADGVDARDRRDARAFPLTPSARI